MESLRSVILDFLDRFRKTKVPSIQTMYLLDGIGHQNYWLVMQITILELIFGLSVVFLLNYIMGNLFFLEIQIYIR